MLHNWLKILLQNNDTVLILASERNMPVSVYCPPDSGLGRIVGQANSLTVHHSTHIVARPDVLTIKSCALIKQIAGQLLPSLMWLTKALTLAADI